MIRMLCVCQASLLQAASPIVGFPQPVLGHFARKQQQRGWQEGGQPPKHPFCRVTPFGPPVPCQACWWRLECWTWPIAGLAQSGPKPRFPGPPWPVPTGSEGHTGAKDAGHGKPNCGPKLQSIQDWRCRWARTVWEHCKACGLPVYVPFRRRTPTCSSGSSSSRNQQPACPQALPSSQPRRHSVNTQSAPIFPAWLLVGRCVTPLASYGYLRQLMWWQPQAGAATLCVVAGADARPSRNTGVPRCPADGTGTGDEHPP